MQKFSIKHVFPNSIWNLKLSAEPTTLSMYYFKPTGSFLLEVNSRPFALNRGAALWSEQTLRGMASLQWLDLSESRRRVCVGWRDSSPISEVPWSWTRIGPTTGSCFWGPAHLCTQIGGFSNAMDGLRVRCRTYRRNDALTPCARPLG